MVMNEIRTGKDKAGKGGKTRQERVERQGVNM
jgi:hypothetical protein